MDVTHAPLLYGPTFIGMIFLVMGVPFKIKTDNALSYVIKRLQLFFFNWNIEYVINILYNPLGTSYG